MAICLYSNGIVEEFRPADLVFTEDELIKSFSDYKKENNYEDWVKHVRKSRSDYEIVENEDSRRV